MDYNKFDDKASIVSSSFSNTVIIRGRSFKRTEIALGIGLLVALIVCVVLVAVVASVKSGGDGGNQAGNAEKQVGNLNPSEAPSTMPSKPTSPPPPTPPLTTTSPAYCYNANCLKSAAFVLSNLDKSANPCHNFYDYACGSYAKNNRRHPDVLYRTVSSDIYLENQRRLQIAITTSTQRNEIRSAERKVKSFFQECVNDFGRQKKGGNPFLTKVLPNVGGWYVINTMAVNYDYKTMLKKVHVDYWSAVFFTYYIRTDWFDWTKTGIQLDLSGMGMPWTYYVNQNTDQLQLDYRQFIRSVGTLLAKDAKTNFTETLMKERIETFVDDVFNLERKLAILTNGTKATLNPHSDEERVSLEQLNTQSDNGEEIDWVEFFTYMFDTAGVSKNTKVVVLEKQYIVSLSNLIKNLGPNKQRIINNYFAWRLAQKYVQELSWEYIHANREYYVNVHKNNQFLGSWRYCLHLVTTQMPDALSSLFVRDHFVDKNKNKAHEIVDYIKESMIDRIVNNEWMEQSTRDKAKLKITNSQFKLGYPSFMMNDTLLDLKYDSLEILPGDHFTNILNFNRFWKQLLNKRLIKGTDKTVWNYKTFDVAAEYYNPWSELIVPAGMLQFPIYDYTLPHYINFGSIGSLISHQLVHAVDEYGKLYKLDGTWWGTWWSNSTTRRYTDIKKCVTDALQGTTQGPYTLPNGPVRVKVDTQRYSPEAIAETSGIRVAFNAYKKWSTQNGKEKRIPGVTSNNDQMFFISYAQAHCFNRNEIYSWNQAIQGTVFENTKVNMALSQLKEFQNAFQCKAGDAMVAAKHCAMY